MPTTIDVKPLPESGGPGGVAVASPPLSPPAAPARQRKRPRAPRPPPVAEAAPALPPVPAPVKFSLNPQDFFRYWHATDIAHPDRMLCYLYRVWPKIDRTRDGLDSEARKYIDKIEKALPAEIEDWRQEIFHRWGSGAYKFVLTDGIKGKAACQTIVASKELDNMEDYPPYLNQDELIMDHPDNQPYVRWLQAKGLLQKENEVQQGEAMKEMTGLVRDMVQDRQKQQQPTPVAAPDASATAEAIKVTATAVAEAASMSNKMMENAFTRIAAVTAEQSNPKTMLEVITAIGNLVNQPKDGEGESGLLVKLLLERESTARQEMLKLNENLFQLQSAQILKMEQDLQAIRQGQGATVPGLVTGGPSTGNPLLDAIKVYKEMKAEIAEELGGGEGVEGGTRTAKAPWWAGLAETLLKTIPLIGAYAVQASHNLAIAKGTVQGQPAQMPMPMIPAAEMAGAANPGGIEGVGPESAMKPYIAMLKQIEQPLIRHLNEGLSGADFANAIAQYHGLIAYREIRGLGKDTILTLLNAYPPIGQVVQRIPQQFNSFLDEFMAAEEIWAQEEREEDGGEAEVQGGRGPIPVS